MRLKPAKKFLGVSIGTNTLESITSISMEAIDKKCSPLIFACANPHSLVEAQADPVFKEALDNSDIVVADGVGVTLMANIAKIDVGPRITGEDYFFSIMHALNKRKQGKAFFFGSSENVLDLMCKRAKNEFPCIEICGTLSPPYRDWSDSENNEIISTINSAQPDVLWVAMTAPKQEKWVVRNRNLLAAPLTGSIGAVFDFYAGTHPRAPGIVCSIGLEWLYRLIREPGRMWRRNFVSTPKFIFKVLWQHVFGFGTKHN